ncbi:ABC transporter ATP-binding protein [Actinomadura chokoriensis]|uniref:ABC transporter ATP-binding protein n=1 Tax=Actinomadura chokoriensis TaxID=454156 RepID=A0ABV4QW60_9ACTN
MTAPDGFAPARHRGQAPVLDLREVTKVYGTGDTAVHALRGVSLTVERGDYVAIMGASGSGKSTLMNIIGCLDTPSGGRYLLDGHDVAGLEERSLAILRNRRIGFVFQSFNLIPRMTAQANVELPLAYGGIKGTERRRRALAALREVGLADRLGHEPNELSGGQQQRVAVARALVTAPSLLLADEPTGALDSGSTADVLGVFDRLALAGRTIIVITHEDDVAAHAKRVVRLVDGGIVEDVRHAPVTGPPPNIAWTTEGAR